MLVMPATSESDPPEVTDVFWFLSMILPMVPIPQRHIRATDNKRMAHMQLVRSIKALPGSYVSRHRHEYSAGFSGLAYAGDRARTSGRTSRLAGSEGAFWMKTFLNVHVGLTIPATNNVYKLNMQTLRPK
jgi:hypothetical protein